MTVEKKLSEIVNRLNKTCEERQPDLRAEREERDRQERLERRRMQEEEVGFHLLLIHVVGFTIFAAAEREGDGREREERTRTKV